MKLKKYFFITVFLIIVFSLFCFPVSALTIGDINDNNKSAVISNCTFNYINFETYSSVGEYLSTPGDGASLYFNSNLLILNGFGTDGFSGSSSYYRTFIFDIVLPYSNEKQNFTMNVDSPISKSTFDFSAGVNSFIKSGSISGNVVKNSDNTLTYSISNVLGGSTLHCQVSFLSYSSWSVFQISFNDISISSLGASDIINNQNSNTEAEIEAGKENTDKILNGWESDVEVDGGDTGSLEDSEQQFIADNQQAADEEVSAATDNIFSSVRRLASSFGAVGTMFRQLSVRVPDFNVFIYFSLIIGIVPLIVGMSINGLRARDRSSMRRSNNKGG